jgi:hypothetical protein
MSACLIFSMGFQNIQKKIVKHPISLEVFPITT